MSVLATGLTHQRKTLLKAAERKEFHKIGSEPLGRQSWGLTSVLDEHGLIVIAKPTCFQFVPFDCTGEHRSHAPYRPF